MSLRTRGRRVRNFKRVWLTMEGFMTVRYPALSFKGWKFNDGDRPLGLSNLPFTMNNLAFLRFSTRDWACSRGYICDVSD